MEGLAVVLGMEHCQAALRHRGKGLRVEAQQTLERHIILALVVAAQGRQGKA
jgi:primosomal replication protein N